MSNNGKMDDKMNDKVNDNHTVSDKKHRSILLAHLAKKGEIGATHRKHIFLFIKKQTPFE